MGSPWRVWRNRGFSTDRGPGKAARGFAEPQDVGRVREAASGSAERQREVEADEPGLVAVLLEDRDAHVDGERRLAEERDLDPQAGADADPPVVEPDLLLDGAHIGEHGPADGV